jgi:hypothetical protein
MPKIFCLASTAGWPRAEKLAHERELLVRGHVDAGDAHDVHPGPRTRAEEAEDLCVLGAPGDRHEQHGHEHGPGRTPASQFARCGHRKQRDRDEPGRLEGGPQEAEQRRPQERDREAPRGRSLEQLREAETREDQEERLEERVVEPALAVEQGRAREEEDARRERPSPAHAEPSQERVEGEYQGEARRPEHEPESEAEVGEGLQADTEEEVEERRLRMEPPEAPQQVVAQ